MTFSPPSLIFPLEVTNAEKRVMLVKKYKVLHLLNVATSDCYKALTMETPSIIVKQMPPHSKRSVFF